LTSPAEFAEQNFFGKVFDLDRNSQRQLAVGCSGCNSSFSQSVRTHLSRCQEVGSDSHGFLQPRTGTLGHG
jgi:hypothetical protein